MIQASYNGKRLILNWGFTNGHRYRNSILSLTLVPAAIKPETNQGFNIGSNGYLDT